MVLLSAAHVQVAISSGIVLLFTTFLFLSGCVIQQRTLAELRIAIKPTARPSPKTNIYYSSNGNVNGNLPAKFRTEEDDKVWFDQWGRRHGGNVNVRSKGGQEVMVEVVSTVSEEDEVDVGRKGKDGEKTVAEDGKTGNDEKMRKVKDGRGKGKEKAKKKNQEKEETEIEKEETPAERRRRIKDEIRQLSQGETPVYYQRRLW